MIQTSGKASTVWRLTFVSGDSCVWGWRAAYRKVPPPPKCSTSTHIGGGTFRASQALLSAETRGLYFCIHAAGSVMQPEAKPKRKRKVWEREEPSGNAGDTV